MSNYRLSLRQRWWKTKGTSWPTCWWTWWRGRSRERKIFRFDFLSFFNLLPNVASQRMMGEMETTRVEEQENYWLIQYQKLLDSKPKGLEEAEDKMDAKVKLWPQWWRYFTKTFTFFQVKQLLVDCGAEELVPVFAKKKVKNAISAIGVALQKALASLQKNHIQLQINILPPGNFQGGGVPQRGRLEAGFSQFSTCTRSWQTLSRWGSQASSWEDEFSPRSLVLLNKRTWRGPIWREVQVANISKGNVDRRGRSFIGIVFSTLWTRI